MMEYVIDSEMLIKAIEKRPCIWDAADQNHKDRNRRREAWIEICEIFFDDIGTKDEAEKVFISKQVETKWRHIRDNYNRSVKLHARTGRFRKYIYADQLDFLRRNIEKKYKPDEDDDDGDQREASNENEAVFEVVADEDSDYEPVKRKRKSSRVETKAERVEILNTNSNLPFEETLIQMDGQQKLEMLAEESDDMAFFRSLAPMLNTLSTQQKMRFRIDIMQQLMKYYNEPTSSSNIKFDYHE